MKRLFQMTAKYRLGRGAFALICAVLLCPPLAEAMVRANLPEWCGGKITTMAQLDNAVAV